MRRALIFILATGLLVGCGVGNISRENADLLIDFEDMTDYDNPPVLMRAVRPDYPEMAREVGTEGRVVLKVLVLEDGEVGAIQIMESPSSVLSDEAITAMRRSVFAPATKNGSPCSATTVIPFVFEKDGTVVRTRGGLEEGQSDKPVDDPAVDELQKRADEQLTPSK